MFNVMSYIIVLILTFIFTYIFGVKETYVLFYLLLLIPVFDFLYFSYSKNKLSLTISNSGSLETKSAITPINPSVLSQITSSSYLI